MKKLLLLTAMSTILIGCNINPKKEERIRKLETEMKEITEKIKALQDRVKELESE